MSKFNIKLHLEKQEKALRNYSSEFKIESYLEKLENGAGVLFEEI